MAKIPKYIANLIASGENQTLDFKFEISNASKIAKTLVAFANTDGGKLLIGVKDNGTIAGIRTDEEVFMIESAAKLFSKPAINYSIKPWNINGKQILEVSINSGNNKPYLAKDNEGNWHAYLRVNDQNFIANNILTRFWKEKKNRNIKLSYNRQVQFLLDFLDDFNEITLPEFCLGAQINETNAENILVDLLILDIININVKENIFYYSLKENKSVF